MTFPTTSITAGWQRFRADENGSMTLFGLYFFSIMAVIGAIAVDMSNITTSRVHLQKAADQAAHAALYNAIVTGDTSLAKTNAVSIANATLPSGRYGNAVTVEDIEFGYFDYDKDEFVVDEDSVSGVRAIARFTDGRGNALRTYLFKLVGYDEFDLAAQAVFETYYNGCLREGFVADGVVDIQSNNAFGNGFCIHSNSHVSLNNGNSFEAGTVVSMPDIDDLDLPNSGFKQNEGLQAALRYGSMNVRIVDRVPNMIALYKDPTASVPADTPGLPDYITNSEPLSWTTNSTITPADFALVSQTVGDTTVEVSGENRVHIVSCKNGKLTIDATDTLSNVVIVTDCAVSFSSGSVLENVRVLTESTSSKSFSAPSSLVLGANDSCAEGGGAQLITMGSMDFAATLEMHGAQLIAVNNIAFAAGAEGLNGASIIAGGTIDGTSNMGMGLCHSDGTDQVEVPYFRMAL